MYFLLNQLKLATWPNLEILLGNVAYTISCLNTFALFCSGSQGVVKSLIPSHIGRTEAPMYL